MAAASTASTQFWGPGRVIDPKLSTDADSAWILVDRKKGAKQGRGDKAVDASKQPVWPSSVRSKQKASALSEMPDSQASPSSSRVADLHLDTNQMAQLRIAEDGTRSEPWATAGSACGSSDTVSSIGSWPWREQHELPCWGQNSGPDRDLASIGLDAVLTFPTLVTPELRCKTCGKREDLQMVRHHPGGCGAFEWTHGIDIDWRWTCCGKHESFCHERRCSPPGSHPKTGCIEAPICVKCFKCPCVDCIARRLMQLADL